MAMPTGRRMNYIERYAHAAAAAYRVDQIRTTIEAEQDRVQYLGSLIGQERQTLAGLQDIFRAEDVDYSTAAKLISQMEGTKALVEETRAGATSRASEAARLPAGLRNPNLTGGNYALAAVQEIAGSAGMTPQRKRAILEEATKRGVSPGDVSQLRSRLDTVKTVTVGGLTTMEQEAITEAERAAQEAQEAAFFAGPSGIRGGFEGMAEADNRKMTSSMLKEAGLAERSKLLEGSQYATEDEALDAALETVRLTGGLPPAGIERDVYERARQLKAYRNDQRADFEQEVLDSRKRLATLERERSKIADAYDDPQQEFLRRELTARGYTFYDRDSPDAWKNQYVQYQQTPDYGTYLGAAERYKKAIEEDRAIEPSTRAENIVTSYTMMLDRRGESMSIDKIRGQLTKAGIKGKEQEDAISFVMAYWEAGGPEQDPAMREMARKDEEARKKEENLRRQRAEAMKREADIARDVTAQMEREQVTAVEDLRREQAIMAFPAKEYARLRAMGKTPEEAREAAMRVANEVETAPAAARITMSPESVLERQRRIDIERPKREDAELQQIQFKTGEVVDAVAPPVAVPTAPSPAANGVIVDPSDPKLSYRKAPSGDAYMVMRDGIPFSAVRRDDPSPRMRRAFESIESVAGGGAPLPPYQPPKAQPVATEGPSLPPPAPGSSVRKKWNPITGRMEEVIGG